MIIFIETGEIFVLLISQLLLRLGSLHTIILMLHNLFIKYCIFIVVHIVFNWSWGFEKRTNRAFPLLSTRWSKIKVLCSHITGTGTHQFLLNASPAVMKHYCTQTTKFDYLHKTNIFIVHFAFSHFLFRWCAGWDNGRSGVKWFDLEVKWVLLPTLLPHFRHIHTNTLADTSS